MKKIKLENYIRDIPDFPKKGIIFKDITPLLNDKETFQYTVELLSNYYKDKHIDKIVAIESRGFIIGGALACKLNVGFVPVRKKGKLPYRTIHAEYELEYGHDSLEMHIDALKPNENVLIIDDLLATGGTCQAVVRLIQQMKAYIVGIGFIVELTFLKGRNKLKEYDVLSLLKY